VRGGFWAPVSGRHFSISLSAGRRPVRLQTETGSQGTLGESGGRRHEVHSFGRLFGRHTMRFLSGKAVFGWAFVSGDCVAATDDAGPESLVIRHNRMLH
jgi:hypothetical protein